MSDPISGADGVRTAEQDQAERLVKQGMDLLLREARPAEAAGTFSQALQLAPNLVAAHLGMAEANFALGAFGIARTAAEYVMRLAPGTTDAEIAQAITLVIDLKYQAAVDLLTIVARTDPGRAYAHALRGYALRALHQDYDASLAESKAARLAGSHDVRKIFPKITAPAQAAPFSPAMPGSPQPPAQQPVPTYQRPAGPPPEWRSPVRRQATRVSFATRGMPIATYTLIGICVVVFLLQVFTPGGSFGDTSQSPITIAGEQSNALLAQGQWWRLITAMFLHAYILHITFNMLSLYFIGPFVERVYGAGRFLAIYFLSGIVGGLTLYFLTSTGAGQNIPSLGASGAIFGIFGAFGAFFFAYRSRLGSIANSMLQQWFFWLAINIIFNVTDASLAWQDHLGGIVVGIILGIALIPRRM